MGCLFAYFLCFRSFFHSINQTQNLNEKRKVYGECFVFQKHFKRIAGRKPAIRLSRFLRERWWNMKNDKCRDLYPMNQVFIRILFLVFRCSRQLVGILMRIQRLLIPFLSSHPAGYTFITKHVISWWAWREILNFLMDFQTPKHIPAPKIRMKILMYGFFSKFCTCRDWLVCYTELCRKPMGGGESYRKSYTL